MSEILVDSGEETLFGSLQRASDDVAGDKRALAGLRDAHQWVELTYSELMSDIAESEHPPSGPRPGEG